MRYVVRCRNCTGPELACDKLRVDERCPKCGSAPATYETDGEQFCWMHRERMAEPYPVSAFFLTTTYGWRGRSHEFPNAKLYEAGSEGAFGEGRLHCQYCRSCQRLYEEFLGSGK